MIATSNSVAGNGCDPDRARASSSPNQLVNGRLTRPAATSAPATTAKPDSASPAAPNAVIGCSTT